MIHLFGCVFKSCYPPCFHDTTFPPAPRSTIRHAHRNIHTPVSTKNFAALEVPLTTTVEERWSTQLLPLTAPTCPHFPGSSKLLAQRNTPRPRCPHGAPPDCQQGMCACTWRTGQTVLASRVLNGECTSIWAAATFETAEGHKLFRNVLHRYFQRICFLMPPQKLDLTFCLFLPASLFWWLVRKHARRLAWLQNIDKTTRLPQSAENSLCFTATLWWEGMMPPTLVVCQ